MNDGSTDALPISTAGSATWKLAFVAVLLYTLLGDRLVLGLTTGGRGILLVLAPTLIVIATLAVLRTDARSAGFVRVDAFWLHAAPYLALVAILPLLGVATRPEYGLTNAYATTRGVVPLSLILIGYWTWLRGERSVRTLVHAIACLILINGVYSLLQFVFRISGGAGIPILTEMLAWDRNIQAFYSERYVILGRSSGFFVNANQLGTWSVVGMWWAICFLRGWARAGIATAAAISLLTSNSRGAIAALAVSTALAIALWATGRFRRGTYPPLLVAGATAVVATVAAAAMTIPLWIEMVPGIDRIRTGFAILTGRFDADFSFSERLRAWRGAWRFWMEHPLGTLGPPQLVFDHPIDNGILEALLQGGIPLVLAFLVLLGGGTCAVALRRSAGAFVGLASLGLLVNSFTSLPLTYTASAPYWLGLGLLYASHRRNAHRSQAREPSRTTHGCHGD